MNKQNIVVFKGRRDGVLIMLAKEPGFNDIKECLRQKAEEAAKFFADTTSAVFFSGRELSEKEELELIEVLYASTDLNLSFVSSKGNRVEKKSKASEKLPSAGQDDTIRMQSFGKLRADENVTLYHKGSLRSGQSLSYAGSIVLYGDLNPGAEIIAEGNIVVLGHAKGLLHAGCSGNSECYVFSLNLQPTQLRISEIISYVPPESLPRVKQKFDIKPSIAYINGDEIVIEPLEKY